MADPDAEEGGDVDLTIVTMVFDAEGDDASERLLGLLSRYVVLTRGHAGCRNVDLSASMTRPGRFVIVQKWSSPAAQQAHFDSPDMVAMAEGCRGLLSGKPEFDLLAPISAHDLA